MRPPAASLSPVVMAPPSRRDLVAASCGPLMQVVRENCGDVPAFTRSLPLSICGAHAACRHGYQVWRHHSGNAHHPAKGWEATRNVVKKVAEDFSFSATKQNKIPFFA